jgi:hypothetical protein
VVLTRYIADTLWCKFPFYYSQIKLSMSKETYFDSALKWVRRKAHLSIKANFDGYDSPKAFTNSRTKNKVCPDISFVGPRGSKNFTEIALKQDDHQRLVSRWKLLSTLASIKNGTLYILAPRGHRSFAERLVDSYSIKAKVYSL